MKMRPKSKLIVIICFRCAGTGTMSDGSVCYYCDGSGRIWKDVDE